MKNDSNTASTFDFVLGPSGACHANVFRTGLLLRHFILPGRCYGGPRYFSLLAFSRSFRMMASHQGGVFSLWRARITVITSPMIFALVNGPR